MRAFGSNFPDFRAIWLGTTKPKLQNRYGAADQIIQTFMPNLGYNHMTNEDVLNRFRTFQAVKLQRVWPYMYERCLISPKRTSNKMRKLASWKFWQLWEGIFLLMSVSETKPRVLRPRVDLCYQGGPFPARVGKVFKQILVQTLFSRTSEYINGCQAENRFHILQSEK
jgi:hypothetical protein